MKEEKITERGWKGHFIASHYCYFSRNTLVEYGDERIVISTVGNYNPPKTGNKELDKSPIRQQIGYERYYETMVFEAKKDGIYWEANVQKEIPFESKWAINKLETETDLEANEMHEDVVKEIIRSLTPTHKDKCEELENEYRRVV
jgi:hypothetical protein